MTSNRMLPLGFNVACKLAFAAVLLVCQTGQAAAEKIPGVQRIGQENITRQGDISCGYIGGVWLSGRSVGAGRFLTTVAERKYLKTQLARANRSNKPKIKRKLQVLDAYMAKASTVCAALPAKRGRNALSIALTKETVGLGVGYSRAYTLGVNSELSEALPTISGIARGSDRKLYIGFSSAVVIDDIPSEKPCILAELDTKTGLASCVDTTTYFVRASDWNNGHFARGSSPIQTDSSGARYYVGSTQDQDRVLQKTLNGNTVTLLQGRIVISHFVVLPDGTVLVGLHDSTSDSDSVLRISPSGSIKTLLADTHAFFMLGLPNGKVVIGGVGNNDERRVVTFNPQLDDIDPSPYLGYAAALIADGKPAPQNDLRELCDVAGKAGTGFCRSQGAEIIDSHTTPSGEIWVSGGNYGLARYYPTVEVRATATDEIYLMEGAGAHVAIAGFNDQGKFVTSLFNTADASEETLLGPDNEIEIYFLSYVSARNSMVFHGRRESDSQFVLGEINLSSRAVSSLRVVPLRLTHFEAL